MKESLEQQLLKLMGGNRYRPLNKSELARALAVDSKDRAALRQLLRMLEGNGTIVRGKKARYSLRANNQRTIKGTFRSAGGRTPIVVIAEMDRRSGQDRDGRVRIPEGFSSTALDGDEVLVQLRPQTEPHWLKHLPKYAQEKMRHKVEQGERYLEGEVVRILQRKKRRLVGTLQGDTRHASIRPDEAHLPRVIDLPGGLPEGAQEGFKALATIDSWESVNQLPKGRLLKVLGSPDQPGIDILTIIHRYGLPTEFPHDVLKEAEAFADVDVTAEVLEQRIDCREDEIITIDPTDARDFDDAIAVIELEDGGWELAVHIADVSHYVRPGSALDCEAEQRGNSVYLVDRVLPMLPEKLSNGLCSLKPDVERFTFCAHLTFDAKGHRTKARFFPAVIRSRKRLTYEQAYDQLKRGQPEDDVTALIQRAWKLASKLRQRRFKNGSLDLDFPETRVVLDDQGRPIDLQVIENDESHQLIEEFMLVANEAVAERILQAEQPSLYRIHEDPDPDKLFEYRDLALTHGYLIGDLTQRTELQKLLKKIRGRPDEHLLKLQFLKSLKRAAYSADSLGHYGLAKAHYTHFTSPIRRYTDLIVHRVLRKVLQIDTIVSTPNYKGMAALGEHLSDTERHAAEAEMETQRLKTTEYFDRLSRERPPHTFEAVVTDVARLGLFIELKGLNVRGLIKVTDLPGEEYYHFDRMALKFNNGKQTYQLGDSLTVQIARVDRKKGLIDFRVGA